MKLVSALSARVATQMWTLYIRPESEVLQTAELGGQNIPCHYFIITFHMNLEEEPRAERKTL